MYIKTGLLAAKLIDTIFLVFPIKIYEISKGDFIYKKGRKGEEGIGVIKREAGERAIKVPSLERRNVI